MVLPLLLGAAAGGSALSSLGGYLSGREGAKEVGEFQKKFDDTNAKNAGFVNTANTSNRRYGQYLLDSSKVPATRSDLSRYLFAQGEQQGNIEADRQLQDILRTNLRRGSPTSSADITARVAAERAKTVGDRRASSQLQAIQALLPNSAALQIAGNLGEFTAPRYEMPQFMTQTPGGTGAALGAGGSFLSNVGKIFG